MWLHLAAALTTLSAVASSCPSECRCDGQTVDCSGLGLDAVPEGIPPDTVDL